MSETQRDAMARLAEIWDLSPDVRLGQLMAHLGFLGEVHEGKSLADIDDHELLAVLDRHREELRARTHSQAPASTASPLPSAPIATD